MFCGQKMLNLRTPLTDQQENVMKTISIIIIFSICLFMSAPVRASPDEEKTHTVHLDQVTLEEAVTGINDIFNMKVDLICTNDTLPRGKLSLDFEETTFDKAINELMRISNVQNFSFTFDHKKNIVEIWILETSSRVDPKRASHFEGSDEDAITFSKASIDEMIYEEVEKLNRKDIEKLRDENAISKEDVIVIPGSYYQETVTMADIEVIIQAHNQRKPKNIIVDPTVIPGGNNLTMNDITKIKNEKTVKDTREIIVESSSNTGRRMTMRDVEKVKELKNK